LETLGCLTTDDRAANPRTIPVMSSEELEARLLSVGIPEEVLFKAREHYHWNFQRLIPDLFAADFFYGKSPELQEAACYYILDLLEVFVNSMLSRNSFLRPPCWKAHRRERKFLQQKSRKALRQTREWWPACFANQSDLEDTPRGQ